MMKNRLETGLQAPDITLIDKNAEGVTLNNLWQNGPTLMTFIRHFGCPFCREWLAELERHQADFREAGMQVVVVAMGEPKHIVRYCDKLAPSVTCLTGDEGGEAAYHAYGLGEATLKEMVSLGVFKGGLRAFQKGALGGVPAGNVRMMPGSFVVDTEGKLVYTYYSQHIADHPAITDLVKAAQASKSQQTTTLNEN